MIEKKLLYASATQACSLLKNLSNPHRLMLICHLMEGRKSVGELAELVGVSHSNMSQHLSHLRHGGVVTSEREAQTIYYSIASDQAQELIRVLYNQFCAVAPKKKRKEK